MTNRKGKFPLPFLMDYGKILSTRGRGVVANMRPCQGRDRGFEPRRSRQSKETFQRGSFDLIEIRRNNYLLLTIIVLKIVRLRWRI